MEYENSSAIEFLTLAHRRIDAFVAEVSSGVESWNTLHDEVMACRDLDVTLQRGVALCDAFVRAYDSAWSAEMAGRIEHSEERDLAFRRVFEAWLVQCQRVEREMQHYTNHGHVFEHGAAFRDRCAAAESPEFQRLGKDAVDAAR